MSWPHPLPPREPLPRALHRHCVVCGAYCGHEGNTGFVLYDPPNHGDWPGGTWLICRDCTLTAADRAVIAWLD